MIKIIQLFTTIKEVSSEITVTKGEECAAAKKLFALMGLCVKTDMTKIKVDGDLY